MPNEKKIFHNPLTAIILILLFGTGAYANTFNVPFILDDLTSIVGNPVIRNLDNFYANLSAYEYNPNRFIGYLTFAINYHFSGLNVAGYHIFNLVIHLAAALLVYFLMVSTFQTPVMTTSRLRRQTPVLALLAALLFVVHPVQTQAVTYIVQRLSSLATFFYLLSLLLYARARVFIEKLPERDGAPDRVFPEEARGRIQLGLLIAGSVFAAVLAMKTKEIAFTLPFAALLYEAFFFRGPWRKRLLYLFPLLLTLPIIPLTVATRGGIGEELIADIAARTRVDSVLTRQAYFFTQLRVLVTYLRLLILPVHQNFDYDYPVYTTFFAPPVFLSFILLASLLALALYLYGVRIRLSGKRALPISITCRSSQAGDPAVRLISFGILWFFLTLSVESSLIPIKDVIFEHRMYLAFFGLAAASVTLGGLLFRNSRIFLIAAAAVIFGLGIMTFQRNQIWTDKITLWQDVIKKSPDKARPYVNLGVAYGKAGRLEKSIEALSKSIRLDPDNPEAYVNLGAALASIGRNNEAIKPLSRALELAPDYTDALNNLGIVLKNAGRLDEAIDTLAKALQTDPENPRVNYNLGLALRRVGRNREAINVLQRALQINPGYDNAAVELAAALNSEGRYREALAVLNPRLQKLAARPDARFIFGIASHCLGDNLTAQRELSALSRLNQGYAAKLESLMQETCK